MPKEEERKLLEQMALSTDPKVRKRVKDRLVMAHLPLVERLARRYRGLGIPLEDLVQEGTIGLMTAIDKFDLAHDVRLSTYARPWITRDISHASSKDKLIKVPVNEDARIRKFRRAQGQGAGELSAEQLGMTEAEFGRAQAVSATVVLSLDDGEGHNTSRHELIGLEDHGVLEHMAAADVAKLLAMLKPKEADVMRAFLSGVECGVIAKQLDIQRKYVHTVINRAIENLRKLAQDPRSPRARVVDDALACMAAEE
jgi:RNA polymerase sigma factor (sigma-70 family)